MFHYFKDISRAYQKWKNNNDPATIDRFIDRLECPSWLKGDELALSEKIRLNLGTNPSREWKFFLNFYEDFEKVIKRGQPGEYLPEDDYVRFHIRRQDLSYFWEETGEKIYKDNTLRYDDIKDDILHDRRVLISLCFLSVALFKVNEQYGPGPYFLYKLGAQLSEEP